MNQSKTFVRSKEAQQNNKKKLKKAKKNAKVPKTPKFKVDFVPDDLPDFLPHRHIEMDLREAYKRCGVSK